SAPEEVRADAGRVLGDRAAAVARLEPLPAAEAEAPPPPEEPEEGRLESLLEDLRGAGFLDVDRSGETAVPRGALFLIAGGATDPPPFLPADLIVPLTTSLAGPEVAVVAAESSTSTWNLAQILRTDDEAQQEVSTVDQAETTSGTIAVVLSLAEAAEGCSGRHYGVQSGVGGIIPRPLDEC
ncbi:MAG TPA: copper transporter, partial [Actinomycetota bacterium]|nr:copper transporter [Actinomycetota bacterium]